MTFRTFTKKGSILIFLILYMISCFAQESSTQTKTWYQNKYNVSTLEELGLEKLKEEQKVYKAHTANGGGFIAMGLILFVGGAFATLNNISPFSADTGTSPEEAISILGLGVALTAIIFTAENADRLQKINRAIESLEPNDTTVHFPQHSPDPISQIGVKFRLKF